MQLRLTLVCARNHARAANCLVEAPYTACCFPSDSPGVSIINNATTLHTHTHLTDLKKKFEIEPTGGFAVVGSEFKLQCSPPDGVPKPRGEFHSLYLSLSLFTGTPHHPCCLWVFCCFC